MKEPQPRTTDLDTADHFRTIWRARVPVLLASLAVAIVVLAWSSGRTATYESTATLSVELPSTGEGRAAEDDASFAAARFAELATTEPVLEDAIRTGDLDLTAEALEDHLSIGASSTPGFLSVTAASTRADDAAAIATAVAEVIVSGVEEAAAADLAADLDPLERELARLEAALEAATPGGAAAATLQTQYQALVAAITERRLQPNDSLRIVSPATVPTGPTTPRPARDALLAFIVALVVNSELAVARRALGNRIAGGGDVRREVEAAAGLPVLALVPRGPSAGADEAFREVRTGLAFLTPPDGCRSVAVVADEPSTGATSVAVGLAIAAAVADRPVLLVDADLRDPAIHDRMGIPPGAGLGEVLTGRAHVGDVLETVATPNGAVAVLAAGGAVADPAHALSAGFADRVLSAVEERCSLIVADSAPAGVFAEGLLVAAACDLTIVVVDARSTRRDAVTDLVQRLRRVGANPVGIVVNRAPGGDRGARGVRTPARSGHPRSSAAALPPVG